MIQKLAYARNEQQYQEYYLLFKDAVPKQVLEYFDSEWHLIRKQWVEGLKALSFNFLTSTNNRVESLNGKIKKVVKGNSTLKQFFEDIMSLYRSIRIEKDHKALLLTQKVGYNISNKIPCVCL